MIKNPPTNGGDRREEGLIPGSGRSPGIGNGSPPQYSFLENPMDRGAWWVMVHGVAKSQTQLNVRVCARAHTHTGLHTHTHTGLHTHTHTHTHTGLNPRDEVMWSWDSWACFFIKNMLRVGLVEQMKFEK